VQPSHFPKRNIASVIRTESGGWPAPSARSLTVFLTVPPAYNTTPEPRPLDVAHPQLRVLMEPLASSSAVGDCKLPYQSSRTQLQVVAGESAKTVGPAPREQRAQFRFQRAFKFPFMTGLAAGAAVRCAYRRLTAQHLESRRPAGLVLDIRLRLRPVGRSEAMQAVAWTDDVEKKSFFICATTSMDDRCLASRGRRLL
jgi:hypothetical protein